MPVVCDFIEIRGNNPIRIGDSLRNWEANFDTGGRHSPATAFLIFNVRGLTYTDVHVDVKINNQLIGQIYRTGGLQGADRDVFAHHWQTQMIAMNGSTLNNGNNEIQIEEVGFPGSSNDNESDDFELKDVICFFHQDT